MPDGDGRTGRGKSDEFSKSRSRKTAAAWAAKEKLHAREADGAFLFFRVRIAKA
jgi:hypothetical protein